MKTRPKWIIVLAAAVVVGMPVLASPAAGTGTVETLVANWETVAASGSVEARSADERAVWQPVQRGDELQPQTLVQTGRRGRATLTRSASLMILDPSSQVELPGSTFGAMETSVIQTEGSVLYKVDSRTNPHFEVVTPYLVAGVKGTSFLVTVNDSYASVTVEHGLVEVTNPISGEMQEVGPGESIVRHHDQHEMDVFHDTRQTRETRKESKHLDQMVRQRDEVTDRGSSTKAHDRAVADTVAGNGSDSGAGNQGDPQPIDIPVDDTDPSLGHDDSALPLLGGNDSDAATDLIEEMIREGIHDGAIPIDDVIPLPDPGSPNGPTTPPGGSPVDPADILQQ